MNFPIKSSPLKSNCFNGSSINGVLNLMKLLILYQINVLLVTSNR